MKQYILVAGVDYEFNGNDFKTLCDNRMKSIISKNQSKEEIKFTILDFVSGAVTQNDVTYVKKGVKKENQNHDSTGEGGLVPRTMSLQHGIKKIILRRVRKVRLAL